MKINSKVLGFLIATTLSFALVGCGGPSKADVCEPCEGDATVLAGCEDAYDVCEDLSGCKTKDLKELYELACVF